MRKKQSDLLSAAVTELDKGDVTKAAGILKKMGATMARGRKNKYGEKAFPITVRLPVSLKDKLGEVPSDKVGSIVCAYYNYTKAVLE